MWAIRLLESYRDEGFHPLGAISNDEWEAEEERILDIEQAEFRQAQLDNLAEVKRVRDPVRTANCRTLTSSPMYTG